MRFQIQHRTTYLYGGTASESFMEARLTPITDDRQKVLERAFSTTPDCNVYTYRDYFGNDVETFSIIHRHETLVLVSRATVETQPVEVPRAAVDISVAEARQIYRAEKLSLFEFLQPSLAISPPPPAQGLAKSLFPSSAPLGPTLLALNEWVANHIVYTPGSTRIDTPVATVIESRKGVCQDFAQLMIALLRVAGIPARYVTGYIETDDQLKAAERRNTPALVGASESHAWVEAYLPGGFWWPLDPTNRCIVGERHVKVASGRDYHDCTPTRGVFKGTTSSKLTAAVVMQRLPETAKLPGVL